MRLTRKLALGVFAVIVLSVGAIGATAMAADSQQSSIDRIRGSVEQDGVVAKELTLKDGNLRAILDLSGLTIKEPTPIVLYRLKRAAATEGVKWIDFGFGGDDDVCGQQVQPLQVRESVSPSVAASETARWMDAAAAKAGIEASSSMQDYRLEVTATGAPDALSSFVEAVMQGGVVLFDKGQLNCVSITGRSSEGKLVISGIYDYQMGERLIYRDPGLVKETF
jgi:hypothetical protein